MVITPNQLVLVPPGIANFKSGLHRVVVASPREKLVALYWIGEPDGDGMLRPFTHCRKPRVHLWNTVATHMERKLLLPAPEIQVEAPTNRNREVAVQRKRFTTNKAILESLIETETLASMLFHGTWNNRVQAAATRHKVDAVTVLRLLARFFTLRMDLEWASEDRYWVKGKQRKVTKKLGRPASRAKAEHRPSAGGRNVTDDDRTAVKSFYDSLDDQSISQSAMYRFYEETYRPSSFQISENDAFERISDDTAAFITERQFRYTLKHVKGDLALLQGAAGQRRIDLSHRAAIGSAKDRIPYPGHTYIVDATLGDIYLVSAFDRRRLIGRPVIYLVIDAFSSLIVSVHVALEGPNLKQAKIALCRAVSDKSRWLAWLGLADLQHLLPHGCVPAFWLVDRGELHSKGSYAVQLELRTNLSIAAAYRADWKSLVERTFGILNTGEIHWMPGAVAQRIRERGTRDSRLDAVLTLKEFTRILVRRIAILNLTRDMSRHMSAAFMSQDVVPNPVGFWNYGIANKHGSAVFLDHQDAMRKTLPQQAATLTRHGILLDDKTQYAAPWMLEHPAVQLTGFGDLLPIKLIASPDDPAAAWCLLPEESTMREVRLQRRFEQAERLCTEDIVEMATLSSFLGQDLADDTTDERLAMQRANRHELDQARDETLVANQAGPISNRAKTTGIRANRSAEAAAKGAPPAPPAPPAPSVTPAPIPALAGPSVGQTQEDYYERLSAQLGSWEAA